jgi:hypothetical protein
MKYLPHELSLDPSLLSRYRLLASVMILDILFFNIFGFITLIDEPNPRISLSLIHNLGVQRC